MKVTAKKGKKLYLVVPIDGYGCEFGIFTEKIKARKEAERLAADDEEPYGVIAVTVDSAMSFETKMETKEKALTSVTFEHDC